MLLAVGMVVLGLATFAAMLGFVALCDRIQKIDLVLICGIQNLPCRLISRIAPHHFLCPLDRVVHHGEIAFKCYAPGRIEYSVLSSVHRFLQIGDRL